MEDKIEAIYKMIKEIKDEMIGKNMIKKAITEARRENGQSKTGNTIMERGGT